MRIVLIGAGTVGQGFLKILRDKTDYLQEKYAFQADIVGIATRSRGTLYHPQGLDLQTLLTTIDAGHFSNYPEQDGLQRDQDILSLIRESNADVVVEVSHTNLETAQPALDYCLEAMASGKDVVMANKGPVALQYEKLVEAAGKHGKRFRYEGSVMAGTPSLSMALENLAGCTIKSAKGILNGTCNYMLTQMEQGLSYDDVLADAQAKGYAEADPTADVGGWDAASKLLILSAMLYDKPLSMSDLDVTGITNITADDIDNARQNGERYKLIASISPDGGRVEPVRLPLSDPLAGVGDAMNAITFETDLMGDITLIGAGAGQYETGFAILADLLALHRQA